MFARSFSWMSSFALAASLSAQCATSWQGLSALPGADAQVRAMTVWDQDGAGPLPAKLVVGGGFDVVGPVSGRGIAAYDPASGQWSAIGGGISQPFLGATSVNALAVLPNGDLVVAGTFLVAGNVAATCIARWDGSNWHPFANGIGGRVNALAVMPGGELYAAGLFFLADGNTVSNIARWDGTTWVSPGQGVNGNVTSLAVLLDGTLLAGGSFTASGTTTLDFLGRWDGSSWSSFGGGVTGDVNALGVAWNGDVYVGGGFVGAAGVNATGIARWNGASWSNLGGGTTNPVHAIGFTATGDLVIGGLFVSVSGVPALRAARWDGTAWSQLGAGFPNGTNVFAFANLPGGTLCAGGNLANGDGIGTDHLLRFDGANWGPLVAGTAGSVNASKRLHNGDLLVGGSFRQIDGVAARGVARRVGSTWTALGSGIDGTVNCLLELANGDLVVGGLFQTAGGNAAANVARWDGSTWSAMGAGVPGPVFTLVQRPNGQIVAGGGFSDRVAVWNGTAWAGTGVAGGLASQFPVRAMAVLPNGDVAASSLLLLGSSAHAQWDGATWTALSGLTGAATFYTVAQNGDLLAAGSFNPSRIARWNGSTWTQVGGLGVVSPNCLLELPNGDLLLAGSSSGIAACERLLGSTLTSIVQGGPGNIRTITAEADGSLFVGGDFTRLDGQVAARLARLGTNCPAGVLVAGTGCSGSGGPNTLAATSLPWVGSTFRSTASGLPTNGVAIEVLGFAPTLLSLSSLLPQGGAGCNLLVAPVAFGLQLPSSGSVGLQFVVPNDVALVGAIVRQQVLAAELDAQANLVAVTASNALQLVVGAF
jgi:hypothetical protein